MRWQHYPKMNSLLPIFVILGSLHGAPVKINWDRLGQEDHLIDVHTALSEMTSLSSSRHPISASSAKCLPVKSTASPGKSEAQETEFQLQLSGEHLTIAEGFNELNPSSAKSSGPDSKETLYTPSMHALNVMPKFVSTHTPEIATNSGANALGSSSTEHFLPGSSIEDERAAPKVTPSMHKFATQLEFKSEGTPTLDVTDNLQNVPTLNSTDTSDTMKSRARSSEFSAVGWDSTFEQHSTPLQSADNTGPSNSSENWQMPDHPEDESSASVSISRSPGVSDTNRAASFVSITQASDVHEANSMAAPGSYGLADISVSSTESISTNQVPDVSNTWLSGISEDEYATSVSIQAPDMSCLFSSHTPDVSPFSMAASVSEDWLSDVSEYTDASTVSIAHVPDVTITYSTAASVHSDQTRNIIELYSTSQTPGVSEFSMATSISAQMLADGFEYTTAGLAPDFEYVTSVPPVSDKSSADADSSACVSTLTPDVSAFSTTALGSKWSLDTSEYTTASSVSVQDPDVSDMYSTAASVYSDHSSVSDLYSTSQTPDASTHSTAASASGWWLADVSEYSTAASSVTNLALDHSAYSITFVTDETSVSIATNHTPDVSDAYSTAASSDSTRWLPDVSDFSTAASSVTGWVSDVWLTDNSKVGTSMALPHTKQTTLKKTNATELTSSEYPSATLSPTSLLTSEASSPSSWGTKHSGKQFALLTNTSSFDPSTSSPIDGIYIRPTNSILQPFTKATAIGTKRGTSVFEFELSENASYSLTGQSTTIIQAPLLLQFTILNQNYTDSLSDRSSEDYKDLETVVKRTLDAIFHTQYGDNFLGIEILGFRNGSVKVECEVVFQEEAAVPTGSHIVRTVLTHLYHKDQIPMELIIDANSVACNGYSLTHLNPEVLLIEFTALSTGFGPWSNEPTFLPDVLQNLSRWVVATLEEKYVVQEFNIGRVVPIQGDVNIQGTALVNTPVHVDNVKVLVLLNNLVNTSVDLRSLKVNGSSVNLGVLPISFVIENREYNTTLRDSRSAYFCSLGKAVTEALQTILKPKYSHFVQAVIKHFGHGSVISTSDLVFQNTLPASHEVLDMFFNLVNANGFLMGTDFKVDAYSFTVGVMSVSEDPSNSCKRWSSNIFCPLAKPRELPQSLTFKDILPNLLVLVAWTFSLDLNFSSSNFKNAAFMTHVKVALD
ncbi:mucin-3A-like isoform X2 [Pristis pectinata]|uniref:mucin-3A-like isoform X2 n=1 Tax=Pristis pectinata TaxID=685728 RepID=UPI00223C8C23|nr:mucin-3A-like isoform X2 [Pristis pectinata]XP_051898520.1 mucin-3A-like isoform X2 [Pristis pectinata]